MTESDLEAADNIIGATITGSLARVFFLGPYARRVSFSSMQNRALNLVWALQGTNRIAPGDHLAIVGGGLSGVTAAAALIDLGYKITMYDDGAGIMHRQVSADHRYIHPTVNRWPEFAVEETTTVPYFDWVSAMCSDIVGKVRTEWETVRSHPNLTFVEHATVVGFGEAGEVAGVQTEGACQTRGERYKAVLVTSGFADENYGNSRVFPGYWRPDGLETDLGAPANKDVKFLISGCGDGGLIDALRVVHERFDKGRMIVDIARDLFDRDWEGLKVIGDAEAALLKKKDDLTKAIEHGSKTLQDAYLKAVGLLPADIVARLDASLRTERGMDFVTLLSREDNAFSPMSAPIHKLMVAHAMERLMVAHKCCLVADFGTHHVDVVPADTKPSDLAVAAKERLVGRVILRHGAQPNFRKFFKNPADADDLINRQRTLATNLDRRFWSQGPSKLRAWPPEREFSTDLRKRQIEAAALIRRMTNIANGTIECDDDEGFLFYFDKGDAAAVDAARLPNSLFGFKLKVIAEKDMEMAEAFATGATETARRDHSAATIRPGSVIVAALNGRLGPICMDHKGRLVAVTADHLAPASRFRAIPVNNQSQTAVGTFIDDESTRDDLALVMLKDDIDIEPGYAEHACSPSAPMAQI